MTKVNITQDDEGRKFIDTDNYECTITEVDEYDISVKGFNKDEQCDFYYCVVHEDFWSFFKKWVE